ncbi:MAG: hypothetical protein ACFFG0_04605 [Candidatus Thorarchaeota archaeon]
MKTVTSAYETQEAKLVSATPKRYCAFMRTEAVPISSSGDGTAGLARTYLLDSTEYTETGIYFVDSEEDGYGFLSYWVDDIGGTHTDTEEYNGIITLQAGKTSGNWVSDIIDTEHLTDNIIYDKISWTETLNGGTATIQIRTATTSGGIAAASWVTYTNDTLNHTDRYRYYQLKVSLTAYTADSEQGTVRISTVNGQAFLWDTGQDFTSYAGDGIENTYSVLIKDAEDDETTGFLGTEGAGETLGSELVVNGNFTNWTGDDPDNWTIAAEDANNYITEAGGGGAAQLVSDGSSMYMSQSILTEGKLYKYSINVSAITGTIKVQFGSFANTISSTGVHTGYKVAKGSSVFFVSRNSGACDATFDDVSVKEVTDPPSDVGIRIYSTRTGSTQNYTSVSGSFDENDTLTYDVLISPEISNLEVRHKAKIPVSDVINWGTVNYGVNSDFTQSFSGNYSIELDNSAHQWNKYQSASYIYGKEWYFEKIETWAGFLLADTSIEYLLQFIGEMESIETSNDISISSISARDFIYHRLANTMIGTPTSTGTPSPYMSGKRYRVPCKETDSDNYIYTFYCEQDITSIDAVYIRDTNKQKWVTAPSNSTNASAKTVDFVADPQSEVSVDITINSIDHPCDIIEDILKNKAYISSDYYSSTDLTTSKTRTSNLTVGVSFENISALQAIQYLQESIDGASFVEDGKFRVVTYYPDLTSTQSFTESTNLKILSMKDSIEDVQNKVSVYYGDYDDDKTQYYLLSNQVSINRFGEQARQNFNFKYNDPVSITSSTYISGILSAWLGRQVNQNEIYKLSSECCMDGLKTEILDVVDITDTQKNLSSAEMYILSITKDLHNFNFIFNLIRYPFENWLYWHDASDTENLRYLVDGSGTNDDPIPEDQVLYKAYYY